MRYELDLLPDLEGKIETVILDPSLTLYSLRKMQADGLISKNFLRDLALASEDPSLANYDDLMNAPYIAYRNANPNGYSQEEFESKTVLNIEMASHLYGAIMTGEQDKENSKMANAFRKVTKKK